MTRALGLLVLYIALGMAVTLVGYRFVLDGPFVPPGMERSIDGLVIFLSVALNTALAFAAAGVIAAVMARSRVPFVPVLVTSMVAAGVIGIGMLFWFTGLTFFYPLLMAASGALCAAAAKVFGFLAVNGAEAQP